MYFKFKHEIHVLKQKERKRRKRNHAGFFLKIRFEKFERTISENHCFYVNKSCYTLK